MIIRVAASLVTLLGAIFVTHETLARSGGGLGGGLGGVRAAAPATALHPAGLPLIRGRVMTGPHAFRTPFLRHRHFGNGWSGAWGGDYYPYGSWGDYYPYGNSYYPYYDASGYGVPHEPPPSPYSAAGYGAARSVPVAQRPVYLVPYHPGCESQTQMLPWRTGGERSITIVRC